MTCPSCGAGTPEAARFCPECGQPLVRRPDERRLVTVLMADIAGFTSLAESADPEHVKILLDRCFDRLVSDVTAFGGQLDKIVGDELVAQFGAPVAHEDDAERAVRAALQMRETVADLGRELETPVALRIGINTGEVVVGALRAGGDPTVMGDVVNIASRLQTSAVPGQIVVGPATHDATRACVSYETLGPLSVKGREEPVDAWIALEAIAPPGRRRKARKAPLVGRDSELGTLRHTLHLAVSRRRAHLVLLLGDAGVGKTRLASELASHARSEYRARILSGQCAPYGDASPWAPVAEALRQACGVESGCSPDVLSEHTRLAAAAALGLPVDDAEVRRVAEGLLYVTEGLSRSGVDPTRARDDALRAVQAYLEGLVSKTPLVLVLSDLHWADDLVLELLNRLLARLRNLPFVLVGTARPGFEERWQPAPGRHNALVVHLDPLDPEATSELVAELLGQPVGEDVAAFLRDRSGGNPFFVEELVALLRESEEAEPGDLRPERIRGLPATLHGLVAARLDALEPAERSLLEDFAVVGTGGPVSPALALAGVPDTAGLLANLADRDLLVLDGDEYHFKSALIRDVAYGTLTKAERARRHAALAPILRVHGVHLTEQVSHHLAVAAELVDELGPVDGVDDDIRTRALEALALAARQAEDTEGWLAAGRLYDRSLGLITGDEPLQRLPALLGRARARSAQRELDLARTDALAVLEAARAAQDARLEAQALSLLGVIQQHAGEHDAAKRTLADAERRFREMGDASGVASALRDLGVTHLFCGELDEAERLLSEALDTYRSVGDERGVAWAMQNLAWIAFTRGRIVEAEARLHEAADRFAEVGDWGGLGWAFGLLAFVRYHQGRLDEAEELASQIAVEGRETGNPWAVGMMEVLLSNVALWRGRGEEAVRRGREAIALFREIGDRFGEVQAGSILARALAALAKWSEYEVCLAELDDAVRSQPDPDQHALTRLISAAVALQCGNPSVALARATEALEQAGEGESLGSSERSGTLGGALLQSGRVDDAVAVLSSAYAASRADGPRAALGGLLALSYAAAGALADAARVIAELDAILGGTYMDRVVAHWARGFLALQRGDTPGAAAAFDAACALVDGTDLRVDTAIATLARARALEALGLAEATTALVQAADQLDALGIEATGWETVFALATGRGSPEARHDDAQPIPG